MLRSESIMTCDRTGCDSEVRMPTPQIPEGWHMFDNALICEKHRVLVDGQLVSSTQRIKIVKKEEGES